MANMTEPLNFNEFCSDDYQTYAGIEVEDHARIAEINGKLDDADATFVIITTPYSIYIVVYPLVVNDPNGEVICEFIKMTSTEIRKGKCYKGTSYAMLFDWSNIISTHLENIGFERVDFKE